MSELLAGWTETTAEKCLASCNDNTAWIQERIDAWKQSRDEYKKIKGLDKEDVKAYTLACNEFIQVLSNIKQSFAITKDKAEFVLEAFRS